MLNPDGSKSLDVDGREILGPCDYVFETSKQRDLRSLERQLQLDALEPTRLPDAKKMKTTHVEKSFLNIVKKVCLASNASLVSPVGDQLLNVTVPWCCD